MSNAELRTRVCALVKRYEEERGISLKKINTVEHFGFAQAKAIEALMKGRILDNRHCDLLDCAAILGATDKEARGLLLSVARHQVAKRIFPEELFVLNDRLLGRVHNMKRYLQRIGKLEDFCRWLEEELGRSSASA